jgi:solute carrier family 15 oligopeptide transporter 1
MDGKLSDSFTLKPDQMQVVNPLLILGMIPLFEAVIYPAFHKINLLKRPLQKMVVGMVLAGAAFAISGFVELKLRVRV